MLMKLRSLFILCILSLIGGATVLASSLAVSAETVQPLKVGQGLPAANVVTPEGKSVSLAELANGKPTLLIFYRGGWCPFCNAHLSALADIELDLRQLGFQIIGITPDPAEALLATAKETRVRYRLVSDRTMEASGAFGIAFRLPPEAGARYKSNGIELPPAPDGNGFWQPVPAAFIVSRDGVIRFAYHHADPANPADPAKLLAFAKTIAR